MPRPQIRTSLHGKAFGLGPNNELISNFNNNGQGLNQWTPTYGVERVELTAVQVRAGFSAPTELVAAPGTGFVLLVDRIIVNLPAGTAFGSVGATEDMLFVYSGGTVALTNNIETTGFLDSATAETRVARSSDPALAHDLTADEDTAIDYELLVGDVTLGRPMFIDVYYERLDLAAFVL